LLVDDTTTLVALAQMCVLEVHTWGARMATLDRPDVLVFDLDPDGEVPWSEEELDLGVTPTQFTVQNVLLRLRTNGDPWAGKGSAILR
jgi:bifunctional non-homologous end joining protein LigD